MKKTLFKVKLFPDANAACEKAVLSAAAQNASDNPATLKTIAVIAQVEADQHPNIPTSIEFIGDNILAMDVKRGGGYEQGCIIEQVEIFELEETGALTE